MDLDSLHRWFISSMRDLPWREDRSPYAVWVSEVMLQQTQVLVVIPYFLRWMKLFPTIEALAKADLSEVIKAWEGLGYYSRARNLHAGAKQVQELFNGELPSNPELLKGIKGIGPYTLGAILSFAFKQKAAAVDGNVIRVLSRYSGFTEDLSLPSNVKKIWEIAEKLLPDDIPWVTNEALIELGATTCLKKPNCQECPLRKSCRGHALKIAQNLPYKSKKTKIEKLTRAVLIAICEGHVWVQLGSKGKIMEGLYFFPFLEMKDELPCHESFLKRAYEEWGVEFDFKERLEKVQHSFTRFQVDLWPFVCHIQDKNLVSEGTWLPIDELHNHSFCSGHRELRSFLQLSS